MKRYATGQIRNVALVGHGGAGQDDPGRGAAAPRRGDHPHGPGRGRHDRLRLRPRGAQARASRCRSSVAPFEWTGHKINLIDTPGYADFIGDVARRAARRRPGRVRRQRGRRRRGADRGGVARWRRALGVPRMVFVNKLDRERAAFDAHPRRSSATASAPGIAPLELPIGEEAEFRGIADLLTDTAYIYDGGGPAHRARSPTTWRRSSTRCTTTWSRASSSPTTPCSSATSTATCRRVDELEHTLHDGIADATVFPVVVRLGHRARSASTGWPTSSVEIGPSPLDRPVPIVAGNGDEPVRTDVAADADGDPLAFVFKTIADPYVGPGQPVPGAVGHGAARRPPGQQPHRAPTSGSTACSRCGARSRSPRPSWWPATSARWPSWPAPSPATRWPRRASRSRVDPIEQPEPTLAVAIIAPAPRPTRTSWPPPCTAWSTRTRPCASSATTRPTRRCCGAPARPTCRSRSRS